MVIGAGFPPYFPSFRWYSAWTKALTRGKGNPIVDANEITRCLPRNFARAMFTGGSGICELSIPVSGGARTLRNPGNLPEAVLSCHGNWQHVHMSAVEALYGRAPFFQHVFPLMEEVYRNWEGSLQSFNTRMHEAASWILDLTVTQDIHADTAFGRGKELLEGINPDYPALDAFMKLGPEAILPLLAFENEI